MIYKIGDKTIDNDYQEKYFPPYNYDSNYLEDYKIFCCNQEMELQEYDSEYPTSRNDSFLCKKCGKSIDANY